jgi:hypothetical protein
MRLDEVVHGRWCLAGELEQIIGHPIVTTLLVEFGHHREVLDSVRRYASREKLLAPAGHRHVAIADRPARGFGKDAGVVIQIGGLVSCQVVDLADGGAGSSRTTDTARATSSAEIGEVLPQPIGSANSSASRTPGVASSLKKPSRKTVGRMVTTGRPDHVGEGRRAEPPMSSSAKASPYHRDSAIPATPTRIRAGLGRRTDGRRQPPNQSARSGYNRRRSRG